MTKKELTFKYFRDNPNAVWGRDNSKHYKKLGITKSTYITYRREYVNILQLKESSILKLRDPEKYFKGRPREKFRFDDRNLFRK